MIGKQLREYPVYLPDGVTRLIASATETDGHPFILLVETPSGIFYEPTADEHCHLHNQVEQQMSAEREEREAQEATFCDAAPNEFAGHFINPNAFAYQD